MGAGAASVRRLCLGLCCSHLSDRFKGWGCWDVAEETMTLEEVLGPMGHNAVIIRGRDQGSQGPFCSFSLPGNRKTGSVDGLHCLQLWPHHRPPRPGRSPGEMKTCCPHLFPTQPVDPGEAWGQACWKGLSGSGECRPTFWTSQNYLGLAGKQTKHGPAALGNISAFVSLPLDEDVHIQTHLRTAFVTCVKGDCTVTKAS